MGNCCRRQSSTLVWAGDDWGSFSSKHRYAGENTTSHEAEKQSLLDPKKASPSLSPSPSAAVREVKIKMTKKELDDLVGKLEMQGLTLEQVLSRLVTVEGGYEVEHQRSWRPSLQSIPEVN